VGPLEPLDTNLQNKNICPKGTMLVSNSNWKLQTQGSTLLLQVPTTCSC
jgi:hypothetical protein